MVPPYFRSTVNPMPGGERVRARETNRSGRPPGAAAAVRSVAPTRRTVMSKKKVLYILHNHPTIRPGGSESYALELYEAMRGSQEFDPVLMARLGDDVAAERTSHAGAPFSSINDDENQHFFFTEEGHFDFFFMTLREKSLYTKQVRGVPALRAPGRRALPAHALHRFRPRSRDARESCRTCRSSTRCTSSSRSATARDRCCERAASCASQASPRRCNECFPDIPPAAVLPARALHPSRTSSTSTCSSHRAASCSSATSTGDIPRERIRFEDYGRWR